jgi:hypothetical protein
MTVRDVRASSEKILPRIGEPTVDAQGHTAWKVRLAVADDYPDGRHEEILCIYADDPRYREVRVPVTIIKRVQQRLAAAPSEVVLVAAAGQPFPSRVILVRDDQGQRVHIDHVLADDPGIACRWVQGPGAMATLKIHVDRTLMAGESFRTAIHIQIDQPVRETLTLPVTCLAH